MTRRFVGFSLGLLFTACGGSPTPTPVAPVATEAAAPAHEGHEHHHEDMAATPTEAAPPAAPAMSPAEQLAAAERDAYGKAKPVFDKYCVKCHTQGGEKAKPKSLEHLDMTSYPFGGHHADSVGVSILKVLGVGGKKTMPKDDPGAVEGEELALIQAWADAFDKAHAGGAHKDHHDTGHKH